jgi:para-nitrobenzyl esterase
VDHGEVLTEPARSGDPSKGRLGVDWKPWPSRLVFDADDEVTRISTK